MKRADDFRKFIADTRTLDESVETIPDGWPSLNYLEKVAKDKPVAENLDDPSDLVKEGFKIWDSVYIPLPKSVSAEPKRVKDLASLRSINTEWERTKEQLNRMGRTDGVHYLRPRGKFILDVMNDDIRMLQGAHILTHRAPGDIIDDDYTFGQLSGLFMRNLVKLFLARTFNLRINTRPDLYQDDDLMYNGIEVVASADLRSPTLVTHIGYEGLTHGWSRSCVLGSVGIEPHPKGAVDGTKWKEIDKWACLPTLVTLSGWEGVDYILHGERVEMGGEIGHAVPVSDLQGMDTFSEVFNPLSAKYLPNESHTTLVDSWFNSDDFKDGLSKTPQLPCPLCVKLNTQANGVVPKPHTNKPSRPFKEIKDSSNPDLKEWISYVTFMRNCIAIGRKATAYASGTPHTMTLRNAAFKKRQAIMRKIARLQERYVRKYENGFLADAESIRLEIDQLRKELQ